MAIATPKIVELRQRRANLWEQAKSLHEVAAKEKREMTAEEKEQWSRINLDIDALKEHIDREERIAAIDADLATMPEPEAKRAYEGRILSLEKANEPDLFEDEEVLPRSEEYRKAFRSYLRYGIGGMKPEQRAVIQPHFGSLEARALATTPAGVGGATIPQEFYRKLSDALRDFGGMRQSNATKMQTASGATMPIPSADDTANAGVILAENTAVAEQDITFATQNLGAYMYSSRLIRVSFQLLQDSAFDLDSWLALKLGQRLGRIQNTHFTTGTGVNQPLGVVTNANQGSLGAAGSTTSVTYAKLVELEHSVNPAYRRNGAQFMFADQTLRRLKEMVDGQQRPLWLPGMAVNAPDTILGYPYIINQDVAVMAANARSILFGDFSYYFIRDVIDIRVMRLDERYADFLQVGFMAFMRCDGTFVNPGAAANSPIQFYQNSAA